MKFIKQYLLCAFIFASLISLAQEIKTELVYKVRASSMPDKKPPVLIMLHGYGSNESDLFELSKTVESKYLIFSIRAPYKGKEIGYAWYDLEFLPNKQLSYNYKQVENSRAKIMSFISHACKAYKADSTKVYLLGYSQGTIMAYDLALKLPKKISGVVALSGKMLPETMKYSGKSETIQKQHYFIGHGYSDNVIDIKEAESSKKYLDSLKVKDVTFNRYEMPHAIMSAELLDFKSWLSKQLKPKEKK
ncbi:MAG: alpha/beta hydrolase [Bacteroidia bacterium]